MELFKRLRGGNDKPAQAPAAKLERPSQLDRAARSGRPSELRIPEMDGQTHTRRELLRVLTRDTQRFAGIPENWIESHVMLEPLADGSTIMHLRLSLRHWDERFMKYLVAFQRRLMGEIERYEPDARNWVSTISWTLALEEQCSELDLPPAQTWITATPQAPATPAAPAPAPVTVSESDELEEDLARFFAVRDAHLKQSGPGP